MAAAKAEKQHKADIATAQAEAVEERRIADEEAEKIRKTAEAQAADEKAEMEAAHAEALRLARQVKCPKCGEVFDSTEHKAE